MEAAKGVDVISPPLGGAVMFAGREIQVRPLTIGQIPGVMRALKGVDLSRGLDLADVPALIADHGEGVMLAVSVATGVTLDEVKASPVDEFVALLTAVIEVNADFFVQRVAPVLNGALARVGQRIGTGPIPSKS